MASLKECVPGVVALSSRRAEPRAGHAWRFEFRGASVPMEGATFHRRCRLGSPDFAVVLRTGKRLRGRGLTVLVKSNGLQWARVGLLIPKKVAPRAVDRNRFKRLMREWFRQHLTGLSGNDWIVRLLRMPEATDTTILLELERLIPRQS